MVDALRVLAIGDVVGQPGLRALFQGLGELVRRLRADLVIANCENAADGFGLDPAAAERLFACGVHVLTSGNHIWQKREIWPLLDSQERLLRPENYPLVGPQHRPLVGPQHRPLVGPQHRDAARAAQSPAQRMAHEGSSAETPALPPRLAGGVQGRPGDETAQVPGHGHCLVPIRDLQVLVINLEGRVNLSPLRCPMTVGRSLARQMRGKTRLAIVDFHGESVEEKEAFGLWMDGEVSAVVGTHTHVQTADERILPKGTAYITDIGMTGPTDGVIGMRRDTAIHRSLSQMPLRMTVQESPAEIQGCLLAIDAETGRALAIERIRERAGV